MKFIMSTHNLVLTRAIERHVISRINKLEHQDHYATDVRVTLEHDNSKPSDKQFKCSMRLGMPGPDIYAEDYENDLYAAIDLVTKKIQQQVRKRHSKYKARKQNQASAGKRNRQESHM
jgi:putative sigma-54 modulation protein